MFTFIIGDQQLLQQFTFPTQNGSIDEELIVLFEPTEFGIFTDTLVITSGEIVRRIPLLGVGRDTTTSIGREETPISVRVFPTISKGSIQVSIEASEEIAPPSIEVFSLIGEKILEITETTPPDRAFLYHIELSRYAKGVYFIKTVIGNGEKTLLSKIIIE